MKLISLFITSIIAFAVTNAAAVTINLRTPTSLYIQTKITNKVVKIITLLFVLGFLGCNRPGKMPTNEALLPKNSIQDSARIDTNFRSLRFYEGDTTRYLHDNFVEKSDFYVGQPVSALFNRLGLPILSATPFPTGRDREMINGINVTFHKDIVTDHLIASKRNPGTMVILFRESLPRAPFYSNKTLSRAERLAEHIRVYRNLTIQKIDSVRYNFNKIPPTPEELEAIENMPKIN